MARRPPSAPGRRGFLRKIVGAEFKDQLRQRRLVEDYRDVLGKCGAEIGFGAPLEDLPAHPREIADAILKAASSGRSGLSRPTLRYAYASLVMFCDERTLAKLHAGRDLMAQANPDPETEEQVRVAFEIRQELLRRRTRMEAQFDRAMEEADAERRPADEKPEEAGPEGGSERETT